MKFNIYRAIFGISLSYIERLLLSLQPMLLYVGSEWLGGGGSGSGAGSSGSSRKGRLLRKLTGIHLEMLFELRLAIDSTVHLERSLCLNSSRGGITVE